MAIGSQCEITGFYARTLIRLELLCRPGACRHLQSFMWLNYRSSIRTQVHVTILSMPQRYIEPSQYNVKSYTYVLAKIILVFVTFSMVNFVFPFLPANLPIALDKWSPFRGLTEKI